MTPQTRGIVPEPEGQRILDALALRAEAQKQVELAVADALKAGGSVREVSALSGLSGTTVQKYGRAHGWPTSEQRAGWEAQQASQDEGRRVSPLQPQSWPAWSKPYRTLAQPQRRSRNGK